jgi:uncharacterized membrane protein
VESFFDWINQYFISPIWERTGYNTINTAAYALIAIGALFLIYLFFEKKKIEIDKVFWLGALSWVLYGSSARVVTDAVDGGAIANAMQNAQAGGFGIFSGVVEGAYSALLGSGIFDYGYLTVSPGIYIATAALFLTSVFIERKIGIKYFSAICGASLGILNLIVLAPCMKYYAYGMLAVLIAAVAAFALKMVFKLNKFELWLPVFGHCLDGAATWVAIDLFSEGQYFEQHVLSRAVGEATPFGFGLFFAIKACFALAAVLLIKDEENTRLKMMALLAIAIVGLAPGIRDILRMMVGA